MTCDANGLPSGVKLESAFGGPNEKLRRHSAQPPDRAFRQTHGSAVFGAKT